MNAVTDIASHGLTRALAEEARAHSSDFHPGCAAAMPAAGWHIRNNLFKYHAACYMTHAPIEAARKLREQHGVTPDQVEGIRLRLNAACDRICNIPAPHTGLEAKFSLRLTVAMGLAGVDTGRLSTYSEATAADPTLVALRDKVAFDFRDDLPSTLAEMELLLKDGTHVTARHDAGLPMTDVALQGQRLREKFVALVAPMLGVERSDALQLQIDRLDKLPNLRPVMEACAMCSAA